MQPPEITSFYDATQRLREAMERDLYLDDFERISLENHIALIQMTYIEWKTRNRRQPPKKAA
jgi:hypothetical protein